MKISDSAGFEFLLRLRSGKSRRRETSKLQHFFVEAIEGIHDQVLRYSYEEYVGNLDGKSYFTEIEVVFANGLIMRVLFYFKKKNFFGSQVSFLGVENPHKMFLTLCDGNPNMLPYGSLSNQEISELKVVRKALLPALEDKKGEVRHLYRRLQAS